MSTSNQNTEEKYTLVPTEWPLRFSRHNFGVGSYDTYGLTLLYNNHYMRRENEDGIKFTYGEKEKILMTYLSENQKITIEKFAEIAKINPRSASHTLVLLVLSNVLKIQPDEVMDWYYLS